MKVYAVIVRGSLVAPYTNRSEAQARQRLLADRGAVLEEVDFSLNKAGILDAIGFANLHLSTPPATIPVDPELVSGPGQDTEGRTGANMDFDLDPVDAVGVDTEDDVFLTDDDDFDFDSFDSFEDDDAPEPQRGTCASCVYLARTKDGTTFCDNEMSDLGDSVVNPDTTSCVLWDGQD